MKKIITLALATVMVISATATAFAADTATDIGPESEPKNGSTEITYNVAPTYTVTIPDSVNLDTATSTANKLNITASNVVIPKGKELLVKLTGTSGTDNALTVKTAEGAEIAYTITKDTSNVAIGDTVLAVNPETANNGSSTLKFIAPDSVTYAGTYSGTVTFTVSVV
ncbi:MAG: hypothetical protein ACI4RI_05600 [Ruminococcus sp.]